MAKVLITITDLEGKDGAVNMDYKFDPELPQPEENGQVPLSAAQTMAMNIFYFLKQATGAQDDENQEVGENEGQEEACSKTSEEGTCCGGNCHND